VVSRAARTRSLFTETGAKRSVDDSSGSLTALRFQQKRGPGGITATGRQLVLSRAATTSAGRPLELYRISYDAASSSYVDNGSDGAHGHRATETNRPPNDSANNRIHHTYIRSQPSASRPDLMCLWFTEKAGNKIGRLTTSGSFTDTSFRLQDHTVGDHEA